MGRVPRVDVGQEVYHVIIRANARMQIFFKEEDYQLLEQGGKINPLSHPQIPKDTQDEFLKVLNDFET